MNQVNYEFVEMLFDEFYCVKEKQNIKQYKYEGSNKLRFVFVFDSSPETQLHEAEMSLLMNIISSGLKIKLEDIALVNIAQNENAKLSDIILSMKPLKMIVWGCDELVKNEEWKMENNQIANIRSTQLLKAATLTEYTQNQQAKSALWNNGIKKML